jgi:hypothetical protein
MRVGALVHTTTVVSTAAILAWASEVAVAVDPHRFGLVAEEVRTNK